MAIGKSWGGGGGTAAPSPPPCMLIYHCNTILITEQTYSPEHLVINLHDRDSDGEGEVRPGRCLLKQQYQGSLVDAWIAARTLQGATKKKFKSIFYK